MAYTVFFREGKKIFTASDFINQQPLAHTELLQATADALAINGRLDHPQASKTANGEWSVLIEDANGDAYIYTLFTSRLEQEETKKETDDKESTKRTLVIIDPSGPRDSIGGYHPGYWSVEHYASLLEDEQRNLFLQTVAQINNSIPSDHYSVNKDGSIAIHIHKEGAYTITISCRAEWR